MSRALYFVLALSLVGIGIGCGGGGDKNPLLGKWTLDMDALKELPAVKEMPDAERQMTLGMLGSMKMELEFTETEFLSTMSMMGQEQKETLSYTIKNVSGNKYELTSKDEQGKEETLDVEVNGDAVVITHPEDGPIALKRME